MNTTPARGQVLVVDDDAGLRSVFTLILEDEGFVVETAQDGADALRQLHAGFRPCVILLDLMMPHMNGTHFRVAQRHDPRLAHIPVALISAHAGPSELAGIDVDAVLRKPINYDRLVELVSHYCQR